MKHEIDNKLPFKQFLTVTFPIFFLPEDCAELSTK